MSSGAAFFVNMTGFNKQAITPDFPARHMAYMLNRNKACAVGSQHAPSDFHRAQDWLTAHYAAGRKNARVWTRFILNLPHDLSPAQRVQLVKEYLAELSAGRAQFVWAVHNDTASPHAHVVFVDKDIESGRRVANLSDGFSAQRWRKTWEACCNRALAWAGSLARVSRFGKRSLHHQRLNEQARTRRHGIAPNAADTTPTAPENLQMPSASPVRRRVEPSHASPNPELEPHMDAVIKQDAEAPSIAAVVAFVASQVVELDRLRAARQTIADYRSEYATVTANLVRTQARMQALEPDLHRAGARVIKTDQEAATHKGFWSRVVQVFSPAARARAKAAKTAADMAVYALSTMQIKANTLLREAHALQAEQTALHEKANALKSSLAIYGTDEDLDAAERAIARTIELNTGELGAVELSQALMEGHITPEEHRHLMRAIGKSGLEL